MKKQTVLFVVSLSLLFINSAVATKTRTRSERKEHDIVYTQRLIDDQASIRGYYWLEGHHAHALAKCIVRDGWDVRADEFKISLEADKDKNVKACYVTNEHNRKSKWVRAPRGGWSKAYGEEGQNI